MPSSLANYVSILKCSIPLKANFLPSWTLNTKCVSSPFNAPSSFKIPFIKPRFICARWYATYRSIISRLTEETSSFPVWQRMTIPLPSAKCPIQWGLIWSIMDLFERGSAVSSLHSIYLLLFTISHASWSSKRLSDLTPLFVRRSNSATSTSCNLTVRAYLLRPLPFKTFATCLRTPCFDCCWNLRRFSRLCWLNWPRISLYCFQYLLAWFYVGLFGSSEVDWKVSNNMGAYMLRAFSFTLC